jgi:CRISPR-associated protein Cas5t
VIALHIEVPYGSFRKSYARSLAETYPFPPPATVYGMLLSLVGERLRVKHSGVKLAFAFARQPRIARTLQRMSGAKYGVSRTPDFVETLCGIEFLCWVDSSEEQSNGDRRSLETRLIEAFETPEIVSRTGVVCLGLSDNAVNDVSLVKDFAKVKDFSETWHWLTPQNDGQIELPVWVDHVGAFYTRWRRYHFDASPSLISSEPPNSQFTPIRDPR